MELHIFVPGVEGENDCLMRVSAVYVPRAGISQGKDSLRYDHAMTRIVDRWVNQAYSRLSTTHGHITDCKLDSVGYAGAVSCGSGVGCVCVGWGGGGGQI